jgi:hypothetical protein
MKKILFTYFSLSIVTSCLLAQVGRDMNNGTVNISLNSNGLFFNKSGMPGFETPVGSGKHMVNFSSFWLSAIDPAGKFRQSVVYNPANGIEFWPGPIDTFTRTAKTDSVWDYIWQVDNEMIQTHRKSYNLTGYNAPDDIKSWPGSTKKGENLPAILAPYYDWDNNAKYDFTKGDFPYIEGNKAAYIIGNDVKGEHLISAGPPLTAEMQLMTYFVPEPEFKDVVFVNAHVINRSDFAYKDLYVGLFADLVLGNIDDNFIGTDVKRKMVFGYNADDNDEGTYGYGQSVPLFGVQFLNQNISSSIAFTLSDSLRNYPQNGKQVRNVMEGKWPNGTDIVMTGNGTGGGVSTNYLFAGRTDPNHPELDWKENVLGEKGGKRNMLIVSGPYQLGIGKSIKFDIAFLSIQDKRSVIRLEELADEIKDYFYLKLNTPLKLTKIEKINLWPNPVFMNDPLNISFSGEGSVEILIRDMSGRKVLSGYVSYDDQVLSVAGLNPGLYFVEMRSESFIQFEKLIIN